MKVIISCIGFLLLFCICFFCFILTIFSVYPPISFFYTAKSFIQGENICPKYYNGSLYNGEIKNIEDTKGFKSEIEAINNYPWGSQYQFNSPGMPYCKVEFYFNPSFKKLNYKSLNPQSYEGFNINNTLQSMDLNKRINSSVFYNNTGYLVLYKENSLYYVYGYFGFYSVP